MPCDYKKYHKDWHKTIRPAILKRANNCCEECGIQNKLTIERGMYNGIEVYQDVLKNEGAIYRTDNSEYITSDYLGSVNGNKLITVVLTIAHLDHDITNNDYSNLKALCQLHHLRYDSLHHKKNRFETFLKKKKQLPIKF